MALKALMLRKDLTDKQKVLDELKAVDFATREADLEASIAEAETDEQKAAVQEAVEAYDADRSANESAVASLETEIAELEEQLRSLEAEQKIPEKHEERKEDANMNTPEELRVIERQAFSDYVRGVQTRDDYNMVQGNNGAIVPKTIADQIITAVSEICPIFEQATKYAVKGTLEVPYYPYSADHVIGAAYVNEMASMYSRSGDFGAVELTGFVAGALAKISKKIINNADIDVVPFVVEQMAEAFKAFYEHECLLGTDSKATGLLAGIAAGATVTGTYKSSIVADDLISCQMKVPTAYQSGCCWIMKPATFENIRKLKDEEGRYLLAPDYREGFGYTLLGKPVYLSDNMPALGTQNNKAVVYGDPSGLGVKLAENLEVQVLTERFADVHAVGVIGWTEIDTKVINAQKFACIKCGSSDPV